MPLFEVLADRFNAVATTGLRAEGVRERGDLQRLLRDQVEIVAPGTLLLAEEFGEWEDSRRRIDLLALDKQANLVVIELKTEEDGGHLELQALRYAAMVSKMTFEQARDAHEKYRRQRGLEGEAASHILEFLGWSDPTENQFGADVRIVLVAPAFSREVTSTVMWLNERDIDIRCIRVRPYKLDDRLLADVEQVIPLPEAEEYQVRLRQKESEQRAARRVEPTLDDFWRDLSQSRSTGEADLARDLHDWSMGAGIEVFPAPRGFTAGYTAGGAFFGFFKVRGDGEIIIWFQYLANKMPFADAALRDDLRKRLCEIPGVQLSPERLSGKPTFALSLLSESSSLKQFKDTWLWALQVIRSAPAARGGDPAATQGQA